MTRSLTVVQPLPPGDHAPALSADPGLWLPAARPAGPDRWRIELRAGDITRPVQCRVGSPWRTGDGLQRRLRWTPVGEDSDIVPVERLLPSLDGVLLLAGPPATPSLLLDGDMEVPLGPVGEAVDALLLHRVARRTAADLLARTADRLTAVTAAGPQSDRHVREVPA